MKNKNGTINKIRRLLAYVMLLPAFMTSFYLLKFFIHYPLGPLFIITIIAIVGFSISKWLFNYTKKELSLDKLFQGISFPNTIIRIRDLGIELVFVLLMLAIDIDPVKDLVELKQPSFLINYLFYDLALLVFFLSLIPMFIWIFFTGIRETQNKSR